MTNTNINGDNLIFRYKNGIKLIKPECANPPVNLTVSDVSSMPVNIIFLNHESKIQWINDQNAATLGFNSQRSAIGKTIKVAYKSRAAQFSLQHDHEVITCHNTIIKDESCERVDSTAFQAITAKLPWYGDNDNIIGLMGCSITLGLNNTPCIQDALRSFVALNLFDLSQKPMPVLRVDNLYFTKREMDVIRHVINGKTAREIARILDLSPRTIECYLVTIKEKTGAKTKSQLIERLRANSF